MSQYMREHWELVVEFPSRSEQEYVDPENAFPNDYVSRVIAFIGREWGGLPEELPEFCEWTDTTVKVTADVLDAMVSLISYIGMHTIPDKLTLER